VRSFGLHHGEDGPECGLSRAPFPSLIVKTTIVNISVKNPSGSAHTVIY